MPKFLKYFFIASTFILLVIYNQLGTYYFNYPFDNDHLKIKANLLKYFSNSYFQKINLKDSLYELKYITDHREIYKWQLIELDSFQFYYLLPPQKIEAIDNFIYYVNCKNNYFESFEISMSISPDGTSPISINDYYDLRKRKRYGKIHLPVLLSIHERGQYIMNLILQNQVLKLVKMDSTVVDMFKKKKDFLIDLNSTFQL